MTHELSLFYWFAIVNILTWAHAYYDGQRFGEIGRKDKLVRVIIRLAFLCTAFLMFEPKFAAGVVVLVHVWCWNIFDPLVAMFAGHAPDYIGTTSSFDLLGRKIKPTHYMRLKFLLLVIAAIILPYLTN